MARIYTVGALAIAARRANAIGAVRLTCAPDALEIELVRAAGFSSGFAPAAVARDVSFEVPYTAVRGLVREGKTLYLALDPEVAKPYNRFALVRFSTDPAEVLAQAYTARFRARAASFLLPAPAGVAASILVPPSLVGGLLGHLSLALLVALALYALLREIAAFRTWGGPISDGYRDAFEAALSRRLGLLPARVLVDGAVDLVELEQKGIPEEPSPPLFMRPAVRRTAFGVAFVVAIAVGSIAAVQRLEETAATEAAPTTAMTARVSALSQSLRARGPRVKTLPKCICLRADSPLWRDGIPSMSVLTFARETQGGGVPVPTEDARGASKYDFQVAAVNNSADPVHEVRVVFTFARRNKRGNRAGVTERGLYWEGQLVPGHAVKWNIKGPGSEMQWVASVTGTLEESRKQPAPADAFYQLASSRFRPVRVHAAMMLAYLRDPRASEAADRLLAGATEVDAAALASIARAAAPVFACDVGLDADSFTKEKKPKKPRSDRASACLFNASAQPVRGAQVRDLASGKDVPVDVDIPVHEGVRFSWPSPKAVTEVAIVTASEESP